MNQMYNMEAPMMPWRMVPVPMPNMPNMPNIPMPIMPISSSTKPMTMPEHMQMMHMHIMMQMQMQMCITMQMNTMQMMDKMDKK